MSDLFISGVEYKSIPNGDCIIGSADDDPLAWGDEHPLHTIQFPYDYWCARFPLTNQQFDQFVSETGFITLAEKLGWAFVFNSNGDVWEKIEGADWRFPTGPGEGIESKMNHPAAVIGFYDALAYLEWLNQRFSADLPEGYQLALPTEVEWEKVARGPGRYRYPWGDDWDRTLACWYESRDEVGTMPIGSFSPAGDCVYGCADMAGNIWEWTSTLWGPDKETQSFKYPYQGDDGREDQAAGKDYFRIIRGGSFKNDPEALRSACRDLDPPDYALNNLGFRVFITPR